MLITVNFIVAVQLFIYKHILDAGNYYKIIINKAITIRHESSNCSKAYLTCIAESETKTN